MATFLMLGKYSIGSIREISVDRTRRAKAIIREHQGKTKSMHALLGGYDLVFLVELPDVEAAMRVSVDLARETGISFSSYPAVSVGEFDKLAAT